MLIKYWLTDTNDIKEMVNQLSILRKNGYTIKEKHYNQLMLASIKTGRKITECTVEIEFCEK